MAAPRKKPDEHNLSKRERQIMQAVYKQGQTTVVEILGIIPNPPTADAVRRLCHILEDKGHLKSRPEKGRRIYSPKVAHGKASRKALDDLMDTYFSGSPGMLVASLLDSHRDKLSPEDIARLGDLVEEVEEG